MKKLLMIAAMAMFATVACDKDEPGPGPGPEPTPGAPKATIVAAPTSVAIDAAGAFNVTLDKAATEDVTIAVANAGEATLTVAAAEIKITKGATTASVAFTGKAEGSAKVTFTTTSKAIELVTKELSVSVTKEGPKPIEYTEYPMADYGTYGGLVSAKVGDVTINAGTEYIDEAASGCFSKFINTPLVPFATGSKLTVTYSTGVVYDGTEGSGLKKYYIDAYADWNMNGKFEPTERLAVKEVTGDDSVQTVDIDITVPETAVASSRVRVVYASNTTGTSDTQYAPNEAMDSGAILEFMYTK